MSFPWYPKHNHRTRRARAVVVHRRRGLRFMVMLALVGGRAWAAGPGAAEIPVPDTVRPFVQAGAANWNPATATLTQQSANAQLNWAKFNIGSNATVTFNQPSPISRAINRIWDGNPSQIYGHLRANGQVYLLNQNGIVFGPTAQVNVGTLVASALDITPAALSADIGTAINSNDSSGNPSAAFAAFTDSAGNAVVSGSITVLPGANVQGKQIFMFAPNVTNSGHIETTDGQAILAAGSSIYLMQSSTSQGGDFNGYVVEVNTPVSNADFQNYMQNQLTTQPDGSVGQNPNASLPSGTVTNSALGEIIANHGNASLIGLAVNQEGRISATTTVNVNGSIRLVARDQVQPQKENVPNTVVSGAVVSGTRAGAVVLGANSVTEVRPDLTDSGADVDKDPQQPSNVNIAGRMIFLDHGAGITATSGAVSLTAANNPQNNNSGLPPDDSWVYLADGSNIDVSGAQISLPMSSNLLSVQLRTPELLDSPLQTGLLYGKTITVDLRQHGTRADGSAWIGTPLVDLTGDAAGIKRTVAERSLTGGTVTIDTAGSAVVNAGADINLSGGVVHYQAGTVSTTQLVSNGVAHNIANASPDLVYSGFADTVTVNHVKWGITQKWNTPGGGNGRFENAYDVGMDAGTFTLKGPQLVLDGNVHANTVVGPYQRNAPTRLQVGQLLRWQDEVPLGAQLVIGEANPDPKTLDYRAPNVLFSANESPLGQSFNPATDAFPSDIATVNLSPDLFQNGISRLAVYSNGNIDLPADVSLNLPAGGSLALTGGAIDFEGQVRAQSGSVSLSAGPTVTPSQMNSLLVGDTAAIDVSGGWINDRLSGSTQSAPVLINGGTVTLSTTGGSLTLDPGSVIDVSGGAWLQANGKVVNGNGGTINVTTRSRANTADPVALDLGATLRGYAPGQGGKLNIAASGICIGLSCVDGVPGQLNLKPDFFSQGGFADYKLTSNLNSLEILGDATIVPRVQTLLLDPAAATEPTGANLASFSQPTVLPDALRTPVNLEFDVAPQQVASVFQAGFSHLGTLTMDTGANILADPGASVSFNSTTSLYIDGNVRAPSGNINVRLDPGLTIGEYIPEQSLWFGPDALLSVAGVTRLTLNTRGLQEGRVLPGGTVNIDAVRGYVAAQAGARIDVSGTSAAIDVVHPGGTVNRSTVASDAGSVNVTASEGVFWDGTLIGRAGGPGSAGGGFSLTLDENNANVPGATTVPLNARTIIVGDGHSGSSIPVGLAPGDPLPVNSDGLAPVNANAILQGGFDSLAFVSRSIRDPGNRSGNSNSGQILPPVAGQIQFQGGADNTLSLSMGRSLTLDAAVLSLAPGTTEATFTAPYIALGDSGTSATLQPTENLDVPSVNPSAGSGSLEFDGQFIDVIGKSITQNVNSVTLNSAGDIRLRGLQLDHGRTLSGKFETAGDLTLNAAQVYPTTLSNFLLKSRGLLPDPNNPGHKTGKIRFEAPKGFSPSPVLEGGGNLTVNAPVIDQGGVIKAPLGEIDLNAGQTLTLDPGSITSTSADGQLIPLGQLQGNFGWAYFPEGPTLNGQTLAFGETDPLPQKRVSLTAPAINVDKGATVDVSGGGDFFAYEFNPGVLSSKDLLANANSPNTFAILPGLNPQYAPYDTEAYIGSALKPGDSVYLSGGISGLNAGRYALLPASYALLPGAYLVTAVNGYQDLQAGQHASLANGVPIVSGYRTVAGTDIRDARTSGFAVQPGSGILAQASYTTATASQFFTQLAATNGTALPRLPPDAGVVAINAGQTLALDGSLLGTTTGRGAAVDINATQIEVVAQAGSGSVASGVLQLAADQLNAFGAESLLLGATRSDTSNGTQLSVGARDVTVDSGVTLQAPELMLAATDKLSISDGSQLTATGTLAGTPGKILIGDSTNGVSGNGAFLRLSAGPQAQLVRQNYDSTSGTLNVGDATLKADGSAILDATSDLGFASSAKLIDNGALRVGAGRVSLGDGAPSGGFVLDSAAIANLGVKDLALRSYSSLKLYGNVSLNLDSLTLETGEIAAGAANTEATLSTRGDLAWSNPDSPYSSAAAGQGGLTLHGARVLLGDGTYVTRGFGNVHIEADNKIIAQGTSGNLGIDGALTLSAPRISGAPKADVTITAGDDSGNYFPISIDAGGNGTPSTAPGLGARLSLTGASITQGGNIDLPSGSVTLTAKGAQGDVVLTGGSQILVGGSTETFGGTNVYAPGGDVTLSSDNHNVDIQAGATINVAGGTDGGDGGSLTVKATQGSVQLDGQINGTAKAGYNGASVALDTTGYHVTQADGSVRSDFSTLNSVLAGAGFTAALTLRQRSGDIVVGAHDTITAQNIDLSADNGAVGVSGTLDASGTKGGNVTLSAHNDVSLHGATIDVHATGAGRDGGRVALNTSTGGIRMDASSKIYVTGGGTDPATSVTGADGQVALRLPQAPGDLANPQLSLAGRIISSTNSSPTMIEEFNTYNYSAGVITNGADHNNQIVAADTVANSTNPLWTDANNFMTDAAPGILTTLVSSALGNVTVAPGIEIVSSSNLALNLGSTLVGNKQVPNTWDLSGWKFNGTAGVLTLRAAGNLNVNNSITDNFAGQTLQTNPMSWSYRLIAGADQTGASPLALLSPDQLVAGMGNFTLAPGKPGVGTGAPTQTAVRTGQADIAIAAAGDIVFGNQESVIYTAGNASVPTTTTTSTTTTDGNITTTTNTTVTTAKTLSPLGNRPYPVGKSDISLYAQGNIDGAASNQLFTGWLYRAGRPTGLGSSPTGWTIATDRFQQGVAAFAGGNIEVRAGGDIRDLAVSIPTVGRTKQIVTRSTTIDGSNPGSPIVGQPTTTYSLDILGGGDLNVNAGGDIASGTFYTGQGRMTVRAGGSLTADRQDSQQMPVYTILGLGNASAAVTARADLGLETVVNPTLVLQDSGQSQKNTPSVFSTYSPDSAVYLSAVGGDVMLTNDSTSLGRLLSYTGQNFKAQQLLAVYPPFLQAAALSGSIDIMNSMTLYPAPQGNLELLARDSVTLQPAASVVLSDVDPGLLPDFSHPAIAYDPMAAALNPNGQGYTGVGAIPIDANVPVHESDASPAQVVTLTGDITVDGPNSAGGFLFAKSAEISAGRDVRDLNMVTQNLSTSDTTTITAGRDVVYTNFRDSNGNVGGSTAGITVDGPGQLIVQAGRNVDLAASEGITTRGNTYNPVLPAGGANITVLTGATGGVGYDDFIQRYFVTGQDYADELTAYMQALTPDVTLTPAAALTAFLNLPRAKQEPMIWRAFYEELRASGEAESNSQNPADYDRGFTAVHTLFLPSATYAGDLTLYFSKIYTLGGGDINLLVPGGKINAGLSAPPTNFGLTDTNKLLGIVAESTGNVNGFSYGDFLVNASRVFAVDGGDIMLWSSTGSIDAGRGSKTAITAPPPTLSFPNGVPTLTVSPSLAGSGIREFVTTPGRKPGVVDLFAPVGAVNTGDAGIGSAGNLHIAAPQVIGADNIQVSGVTSGVAAASVGLGAGLTGVGNIAASASNLGNDVTQSLTNQSNDNGFLGVQVIGFGDE
ncbi:MAG: filamentous hemagglutinin family protein [Sulfuricaulis sp.]